MKYLASLILAAMAVMIINPALASDVVPGALVKCDDSAKVYQVSTQTADTLEWFPNEAVFLANGNSWSQIVTVPCQAFDGYATTTKTLPATVLIKFSDAPDVYVNNPDCTATEPAPDMPGCLKHIGNEAAAEYWFGADWKSKIVEFAPSYRADFSFYSMGDTIAMPDNTKVQVYDGHGGLMYWFVPVNDLIGSSYHTTEVNFLAPNSDQNWSLEVKTSEDDGQCSTTGMYGNRMDGTKVIAGQTFDYVNFTAAQGLAPDQSWNATQFSLAKNDVCYRMMARYQMSAEIAWPYFQSLFDGLTLSFGQ